MFVLTREVLLNDIESLHINFIVGNALAVINLLHALTFLDEESVAVNCIWAFSRGILLELSNFENILQSVKGNLNDLVVEVGKEVTKGLDATLRHKISNLSRLLKAARGRVRNSPACLLSALQITIGEN